MDNKIQIANIESVEMLLAAEEYILRSTEQLPSKTSGSEGSDTPSQETETAETGVGVDPET